MSLPESFLPQEVLFAQLSHCSTSVTEYQLLKNLRASGMLAFEDAVFKDIEQLFRIHFMLFNRLYALRDTLRAQQIADLKIDTLSIQLQPYSHKSAAQQSLSELDKLRAYYLDLSNLEKETRASLQDMLDTFWAASPINAWEQEKEDEAFETLGLLPGASVAEIKRAGKKLMMQFHPDRGGDAATFTRINTAYNELLIRKYP